MSNIGVTIAKDIKKESVFINPKVSTADKIIKDENGKIVGAEQSKNVLATGSNRREAAQKVYGKFN